MQVVGNHQQMARLAEPIRLLIRHGCELIQRIERLKLDTGFSVNLRRRNTGCHSLDHPLRPAVAITDRSTDAPQLRIEQDVIYAPAIHSNTSNRRQVTRSSNALAHMLLDRVNSPTFIPASLTPGLRV